MDKVFSVEDEFSNKELFQNVFRLKLFVLFRLQSGFYFIKYRSFGCSTKLKKKEN